MDCHISTPPANIVSHMVQELVSVTFISVAENSLNTKLLHFLSGEWWELRKDHWIETEI